MLTKPSSCAGCPLFDQPYGQPCGFVPADGNGSNGILVVVEAPGQEEETAGIPTIGKAGQYLWSQLQRVGIERDGFMIHSVLSCRPLSGKAFGQSFTQDAIKHCAPNLDATVKAAQAAALNSDKTFVIVTLGLMSFRAVMGIVDDDPVLHEDYFTYPHWSHAYGAWVLAAPPPHQIMMGSHYLTPTMQFVFQRALEIANSGLVLEKPEYLLDPGPSEFSAWTDQWLAAQAADPSLVLSYDIETPYKKGKNESLVVEDDDYTDDDTHILRCSFCYRPGEAVSVPWTSEYMGSFERIFGSGGMVLGWNNQGFDDSRVSAYVPFNVVSIDAMLAWHVLNTALPKGLGYVTPFYWTNVEIWKHLSDSLPAFYNAKDADAALRCWIGIQADLKNNKLWDVFDRHVVQLNDVLRYMSHKGVLMDMEARQSAETKLTAQLARLEDRIQLVVPLEAKKLTFYQKAPADTTGMIQQVTEATRPTCPQCGSWPVLAEHFKSVGKKRLKAGETEQPCAGLKSIKLVHQLPLWAMVEPFKLSNQAMQRYQKFRGHEPVMDRKTKKITFNVTAMKTLQKMYPTDQLYATVGEFRGCQKILGTFIGRTQYEEVSVPDAYELQPGEKLIDAI